MGSVVTHVEEYDFIVCGGGTAGCVVAGRLAESDPSLRVLVIEAGQHNEHLENTQMTGGWSQLFDTDTDWNIVADEGAGINDRRVKLSRGKYLGGCSGCNGTLCIRGTKQDYDDWGLDGWSGEEFFGYMRKAETFHTKEWFNESSTSHGYDGPLHNEPHDLAPISDLILKSMVSKGMPLDHDMFSHGENPQGCGHPPRTVHQGIRTTGADFITKNNQRQNLTILVETHVDKVILETNSRGELQASGVQVIKPDGTAARLSARKEVIVSGGAYCSPNILNRSGIGARADLEPLGISTLLDLPGVGRNLMDHLIVFMFYETEKPGLTNDHLIYHGDAFKTTYQHWKDEKTGFLSTFPFGAFAYARLDERLADSPLWNAAPRLPGRDPMGLTPRQPNVEFFNTECYGGPKHRAARSHFTAPTPGQTQGRLRLFDPPLDLEVLAEACRLGNEIVMEGKGTRDIVNGSWPPELTHHTNKTREDWIPYVKDHATTCYHASGTCAMGKADNPKAVVDEELVVRGIKNLRVADASIIPILGGSHTQMPAYGIGEKCADLIRKKWKVV
ncbi:hypothetical protein PG997_006250 [Apiospora hydei]|uniref:Glucose-methanol-choline oxidoreductase N-terminal domain-containing protein n=1 Tax=Apiospora hydei TaxID=1337664 RepID=A0ABR1WRN3_9PEZI